MTELKKSSNHRPGEPLRKWDPNSMVARADLELLISHVDSISALKQLIRGTQLADADVVRLAALNSMAIIRHYEPVTFLAHTFAVDPNVKEILEEFSILYKESIAEDEPE